MPSWTLNTSLRGFDMLTKNYLKAHYKMNDDAATPVVIDEIGNYNGTYKDGSGNINTDTGASVGKMKGALEFDGDEYVDLGDDIDSLFAGKSIMSFSAWVKITTFVDTAGLIGLGDSASRQCWLYSVTTPSRLRWTISTTTGTTGPISGTLVINQWYHVVGTYDGAWIRLYMDTVLMTPVASAGVIADGSNNNFLGRLQGFGYSKSIIDNVMFFNKVLTLADVILLNNGGAGRETIPPNVRLSRTGQGFSSRQEM